MRHTMTRDWATFALVGVEATWYCVLDLGESLVKGFQRGWALGMARRVR